MSYVKCSVYKNVVSNVLCDCVECPCQTGWETYDCHCHCRHLGFFKFQILNDRTAQEGRAASSCQIWSKSIKPRPRYGDFSIFQDGGRPPSWICYVCVWTTHEGHLMVFIAVQNLVEIDAVVLIIRTFFDFASLAWKRLLTPQKLGFWGFYSLNGEQCQRNSKNGTSSRESASFEPSCAKIRRRVWPVGEFPKKA